jgi:hypothetical protein
VNVLPGDEPRDAYKTNQQHGVLNHMTTEPATKQLESQVFNYLHLFSDYLQLDDLSGDWASVVVDLMTETDQAWWALFDQQLDSIPMEEEQVREGLAYYQHLFHQFSVLLDQYQSMRGVSDGPIRSTANQHKGQSR